MDFSVFTPQQEQHLFHGDANFKVMDSGALQVWPNDDQRREQQVIYGPAGWLRVDVLPVDTSQQPAPGLASASGEPLPEW